MDLVDDSSMPFPPLDEDDDIEMCSRLSGVDTGRAFTPKETAVIQYIPGRSILNLALKVTVIC